VGRLEKRDFKVQRLVGTFGLPSTCRHTVLIG
jgi:hypothetical protein